MKNGITLFNLRDRCAQQADAAATLSVLKKSRVDVVQISAIGAYGIPGIADVIKSLDLTVPVTHTPFKAIMEEPERVALEHKQIGCRFVGLGAMPGEYEKTNDGQDAFLRDLHTTAKNLAKHDVTLCYHNHDFDLRTDTCAKSNLDRMLSEFASDELFFIPDVCWIQLGGCSPTEYLQAMKGRIAVIHFKDYLLDADGKRRFCEAGNGLMDLKACYETGERVGAAYAIYEQDDNWAETAMNSTLEGCAYLDGLSGAI